MRRLIFILSAIFVTLHISCQNKKSGSAILSQNNLKSLKIQIRNDSAYTLKTPGGIVLNIQPGTFKTSGNSKIEIEIKEALSATDILLAGLETTSNDKPLQSGGMLYFSARSENKELAFNKKVNITVPTEKYDEEMQVFKGELKDDSSINWIQPKPLDSSAFTAKLKLGEQLFKSNCANCHKVKDDFTGPAIAGFSSRIPGGRKWIYAFVRNPSRMIASNSYAKWLAHKWKPTLMTAFPLLSDYAIDAILDYVENETPSDYSNNLMPSTAFSDTSTYESFIPDCGYDTTFLRNDTSKSVEGILSLTEPENILPQSFQKDSLKDGFVYNEFGEGVYSFNIDDNGWYNIDKFTDSDKLEKVNLTAIVEGNKDPKLVVYLLLPNKKIMISSKMRRDNEHSFSEEDGVIELPINEPAIIMAVGSDESDCYFGIQSFNVQKQQQIKVLLKKELPEKIKESIRNNKIEEIQIEPIKKTMEVVPKSCDDWLINQTPAIASIQHPYLDRLPDILQQRHSIFT